MSRCPGPSRTRFTLRSLCLLTVTVCASLPAMPVLAADKTDVVMLVNGDRITGEVKELSYGQLKFKTDNLGTIYIEWDKIASLETKQLLQVELADGRRYFGRSPEPGGAGGALRLVASQAAGEPVAVDLPMTSVVRVATLERGAWYHRLDGSVSVGYSYTGASDVEVFNLSGDVGSRNQKRRWNIALDAQLTNQAEGDPSQRASLTSTLERFMPDRYYYEATLGFTHNQELGLDLRSLVGATFGRYLVQGAGREWRAGAGLAASAEEGSDGSRRESLEAVLTTSLRLFRFDSPETNVTASLTLLPSLTESGRLRGEGSLELRHEIVNDLFFEISLYDSYDNEAPEGAESNDWSIATGLGYSF